MKKVLVMAVIAGLVGLAQADYYITYSSYWGNTVDGSPMLPNVGDQATVQLIFAGADGIANDPGTIDIGTANADLLYGDDVLLYSATFANTGAIYEDVASGDFGIFDGAAFLGENVYGRIFNTASPGVGARYYVGAVRAGFQDLDSSGNPAPPPQGYNLVPAALGASQEAAGQVIPEPATIGLMGIAGLGMYLARRKTRR